MDDSGDVRLGFGRPVPGTTAAGADGVAGTRRRRRKKRKGKIDPSAVVLTESEPCKDAACREPKPGRRKNRRRPNRAERRAYQFRGPEAGTLKSQHDCKGREDLKPVLRQPSPPDPSRQYDGAASTAGPGPAHGGGHGPAKRPAATILVRQQPARDGVTRDLLYAALDLGTNNCRLLVARPDGRGFRVVDAYSRIVRLGEGLGRGCRLGDAAMERALEALAVCRDKLVERGVSRSRLIATEACRAAENGPAFVDRVRSEIGLSLEIVSRQTEARLAVAGCASLVDPDADGVVLFDIGGGSSEIVWLDLRNRCGARGYALTRFIRTWISLPVGVVNLAERHGGKHVSSEIFEAMVHDAAEHLEAFALGEQLSEAICSGKVHMLGTSGTVTTLAGVHFGLKRYDRRRVDGAWLEQQDVSAMIERLRGMPYEERVGNPCIGADRADLVLAGCAILEAIRRRWPCRRLRVADRGLREGILMELMAKDGVWRRSRPPQRTEQRSHGR